LEDFAVGQVYMVGPVPVSADAIKAYARQFDPQPFHTDEELADSIFFQGLVASGWHTASLTMSLVVQALPIAGGVIGGGVDELRWPKPLRPGDELRLQGEIVEVRPSRSKPGQGLVRVRTTTLNRAGETVQTMIANLIVPRRPAWRAEVPLELANLSGCARSAGRYKPGQSGQVRRVLGTGNPCAYPGEASKRAPSGR
jgi:acyl dehydratase